MCVQCCACACLHACVSKSVQAATESLQLAHNARHIYVWQRLPACIYIQQVTRMSCKALSLRNTVAGSPKSSTLDVHSCVFQWSNCPTSKSPCRTVQVAAVTSSCSLLGGCCHSQAQHDYLAGNYPVVREDAAQMCALQLQAEVGPSHPPTDMDAALDHWITRQVRAPSPVLYPYKPAAPCWLEHIQTCDCVRLRG